MRDLIFNSINRRQKSNILGDIGNARSQNISSTNLVPIEKVGVHLSNNFIENNLTNSNYKGLLRGRLQKKPNVGGLLQALMESTI